MLTVYGGDLSAPSNKVRFVLNYLGVGYEYRRVSIRDGENKQDWYLKMNPAGKIPVIDDDGFYLFESGAIVKYICRKHDSALYPRELKAQAVVDQWTDFVNLHIGGAMNRIVFNRLFARFAGVPVDEQSLADGEKFLARFLPVTEQRLTNTPYLAGDDVSLADFSLLAILDPAEVSGVDLNPYPKLTRWRQGLQKQDFYQKCYTHYGEVLERVKKKMA